ncbi:MAG: hypothetical protein ACP5KA_05775 [Desulfurococcaceae archaeon]
MASTRFPSSAVAILLSALLAVWILPQVVLAQSAEIPRGVVVEVAPNVFLYVDPEPIAVYVDECGRVPIYHYKLAPYSALVSPYDRAISEEARPLFEFERPRPITESEVERIRSTIRGILESIERILVRAGVTRRRLSSLHPLNYSILIMEITERDVEKVLGVSRELSSIVSALNSKLFIRAASPETFDVDSFITWDKRHGEAVGEIIAKYGEKIGRRLGMGLGYSVGRLPSIDIFHDPSDGKGDLAVEQVIELGFQLARAVREISGCKLFAIEYMGPVVIKPESPTVVDYRPHVLAAVAATAAAALTGYFTIKRRRGSGT